MALKKKKIMKPVYNNGNSDSPLQFLVKADIDKMKKVKPKDVFDGYKDIKKKKKKK
tara:strand:- start:655 stop:822 length:168 start_codon:yes stop_codon:yes gene_type:complete